MNGMRNDSDEVRHEQTAEEISSLSVSGWLLFFVEPDGDFLAFNPGPAKSLYNATNVLFRHFNERELIRHLDRADHI